MLTCRPTSVFTHRDLYAEEIVSMAKRFGAQHFGIDTDMHGLTPDDVDAVLGDDYLRVLREALTV